MGVTKISLISAHKSWLAEQERTMTTTEKLVLGTKVFWKKCMMSNADRYSTPRADHTLPFLSFLQFLPRDVIRVPS